MSARELINTYLFGGQHEAIIELVDQQEQTIGRYRDALQRIADQQTHGEKWVHWRQIARDALAASSSTERASRTRETPVSAAASAPREPGA